MDYYMDQIEKILSTPITVKIQSNPPFVFEAFLTGFLCVVYVLFIFEIDKMAQRTNAASTNILRKNHTVVIAKDLNHSFNSLKHIATGNTIEQNFSSRSLNLSYKNLKQKLSSCSNFHFLVPSDDCLIQSHCNNEIAKHYPDHIERLLSITPSDYIRHYSEKKRREGRLVACRLESITSLLEKSLNNENMGHLPKETIKRSLDIIKENVKNELSSDKISFNAFNSTSLHNLLAYSSERDILRYILPPISTPDYDTMNIIDTKSLNTKNDHVQDSKDEDNKNEEIQNIEEYFVDVKDDAVDWPLLN